MWGVLDHLGLKIPLLSFEGINFFGFSFEAFALFFFEVTGIRGQLHMSQLQFL